MNRTVLDKLAHALLYEGYLLYPYRPSVKNCQRWTFGALYPPAWTELQTGSDASIMQTQCLVHGGDATRVHVVVKFLHLVDRTIGRLLEPVDQLSAHALPDFEPVNDLQVGDEQFCAWQEAIEREVDAGEIALADLLEAPRQTPIAFPATRTIEAIRAPSSGSAPAATGDSVTHDPSSPTRVPARRDAANRETPGTPSIKSQIPNPKSPILPTVGLILRQQQALDAVIELSAHPVTDDLTRLTVRILNRTPLPNAADATRDQALMRTLVSTHTLLGVTGGTFVSLLEPPTPWRDYATACRNTGTWPVLVGAAGQADTMLSSPIILYDYPQIAPESPGDLFDATEIDEILSLRILTLTDAEKRAAAAVDPRAREMLARTEALAQEQMMGLHGTIRGFRGLRGFQSEPGGPGLRPAPLPDTPESRPDRVSAEGVEYHVQQRVRLRPLGRADIMDIALDGQPATIVAIEKDLEDRIHLAVTVDADPGKDLGLHGQPGHRFFFGIDEVEPLDQEAAP